VHGASFADQAQRFIGAALPAPLRAFLLRRRESLVRHDWTNSEALRSFNSAPPAPEIASTLNGLPPITDIASLCVVLTFASNLQMLLHWEYLQFAGQPPRPDGKVREEGAGTSARGDNHGGSLRNSFGKGDMLGIRPGGIGRPRAGDDLSSGSRGPDQRRRGCARNLRERVPELRQRAAVNADGEVFLPLLGGIKVIGLPLADVRSNVRALIQTKSSGAGPPEGRENIVAIYPDEVAIDVVGATPRLSQWRVSRPGEQRYRLGLTVRQAIALAGGYDIMRFRMIP
jgi:hypothetical protein